MIALGIVIASPVDGLHPCLSARSFVENFSNPGTETEPSFIIASVNVSKVTEKACSACDLLNPVLSAIAAINSVSSYKPHRKIIINITPFSALKRGYFYETNHLFEIFL